MSEQELKPCPFCGEAPAVSPAYVLGDKPAWDMGCQNVHCAVKPMLWAFRSEEEMVRTWNGAPLDHARDERQPQGVQIAESEFKPDASSLHHLIGVRISVSIDGAETFAYLMGWKATRFDDQIFPWKVELKFRTK